MSNFVYLFPNLVTLLWSTGSQSDIPTKGDGKIDLPLFDVVTIAEATNNFSTSNKIGEGGFGPVFKVISVAQHNVIMDNRYEFNYAFVCLC